MIQRYLAAILMCMLPALPTPCEPICIVNPDFERIENDRPAGWSLIGRGRLKRGGGRAGANAVEVEPVDGKMSAWRQTIRLDQPRPGAFRVSAWIKLEGVDAAQGDVSLWLDVRRDGADPLWAVRGIPERDKAGWQKVSADVYPAMPVKTVDIYLQIRETKGRASFCGLSVQDLPIEIRSFNCFPKRSGDVQIRAEFSDQVNWTLTARDRDSILQTRQGNGQSVNLTLSGIEAKTISLDLKGALNSTQAFRTVSVSLGNIAPISVWVADSFTRVFPDDLPPSDAAKRIVLDVAAGERESAQICFRSTGGRIVVKRILPSDLAASNGVIAARNVEWHRVGYVKVEEPFAHPFSPRMSGSWWPDPLLEPCEFVVNDESAQAVWLDFAIPAGAVPGRYQGSVKVVSEEGEIASIPVCITVHRVRIPRQGYMKTAFATMDFYIKRLYGSIDRRLRRRYTDFLLDHRLNPDNISRTDFPDLDELEYADTRGLNAFNILNVVPEPKDDKSWVCFSAIDEYTPEFKKRFFERLDSFIPELEKRGLVDKSYIYGFDERGPEYIPVIRDLFGEVKKRYPRVHTLSTCWPPAGTDPMSLNIDWFVPLSNTYDPSLAKNVRSRGGEMWWYICMGPNYPYANWLLENPLIEARLIFWQAFSEDVEGFLYWATNIWDRKDNDHLIASQSGSFINFSVTTGGDHKTLNGDGILIYPGENGPLSSIRLKNIRDGLEDTEILKQYREAFGQVGVSRLVRRVSKSRTNYTRKQADLMGARSEALRRLDSKSVSEWKD